MTELDRWRIESPLLVHHCKSNKVFGCVVVYGDWSIVGDTFSRPLWYCGGCSSPAPQEINDVAQLHGRIMSDPRFIRNDRKHQWHDISSTSGRS